MKNGRALRRFVYLSFASSWSAFSQRGIGKTSLIALLASFFAPQAFGTANHVNHERSGNNPGCGIVAYAPVLNSTSAQIERSVNLMTWTALGSATAQSNGVIEFEDTNPPGGAFYRTVVP